jgi:UrcA family protein
MKTIALAAVIAASLFAAPAFAQADAQTRIVISPAGLDLTTAEGRAALDLRVVHAARIACGTPSPADAQGHSKAQACVAELRVAAAAQTETMIAAAERGAGRTLAGR